MGEYKVLDDNNVHHFWGISPAIDLLALLPNTTEPSSSADAPAVIQSLEQLGLKGEDEPIRLLQVGAYDCRHSAATLCRAGRHARSAQQRAVHLHVHEEEPEGLARHLLLLAVLLDGRLGVRERAQRALELHGNALLQPRTAEYLEEQGRALEDLVLASQAGGGGASSSAQGGSSGLAALVDFTQLKFQERDALAAVFQQYRQTVQYDMRAAWEARCRKFYGPRFDHRRNLVDWDYTMRLAAAGTPGLDPAKGSIIHALHFRAWRETGCAYELRECSYSQANRSLLSTAYGRTKEFKDRRGDDCGRSVAARGWWGDILNSPYHSWGTACEQPAFYKTANLQFTHTSVDIVEYNVQALLHELRTGTALSLAPSEEAPRAAAAEGPTSRQVLEELASAKQAAAEGGGAECSTQEPLQGSAGDAGVSAASERDENSAAQANLAGEAEEPSSTLQAPQSQAAAGASAAEEAQLEAAAARRLRRFRIVLSCGDLGKAVLSRAKWAGRFDALALGNRHVHLLEAEHGLGRVAKAGALLAVENGKYMLQLTRDQVSQLADMVAKKAEGSGWQRVEGPVAGLTEAHTAFRWPPPPEPA